MRKIPRASVIAILPLVFLTTNGFVHSAPLKPIRSKTEAQFPHPQQLQQLSFSNLPLLCLGRQLPRNQPLRPRKGRNRHFHHDSIPPLSNTFPTPMMSVSPEYLRVSVARGATSTTLIIQASYIDPDTRTHRSWTASRSEQDFFALGVNIIGALGGGEEIFPGPPRMGSSPAVFEGYLRRLVDAPLVTSLPALYSFLDAPQDLMAQEPVLVGEIIQDAELNSDPGSGRRGNKRFRSAGRDQDRKTGAAVAGAVGGWLVGGPVGAAIGALTVRVASTRDDEVGDAAKGAGAVADAALEKAANLEREYDITGKAGRAVRGATAAAKKVDSDFRVRERAKHAAERAVRAAQKADRELRVRERAAEAAKTAERAARRAAEAARKAEREHHLKERAGDAFRQLRFRVQRSVEDLERRRREKDRH